MDEKKVLLQFIYESVGAQKAIADDKAVKAQMSKVILGPSGKPAALELARQTPGFAQTAEQKTILKGFTSPPIIMPSGVIGASARSYTTPQTDLFGGITEGKLGGDPFANLKPGPLKEVFDTAKKAENQLELFGQSANKAGQVTEVLGNNSKKAEIDVGKLAQRALVTIPIWLAMRAAYMAIIQTIQAGVQHIVEFDKALARAKSVLTGVTDTKGFIKGLAGEIRTLSAQTGISANELAEAFYRFGSAGLNAETALAGMNISAKTSIALMGDLTETSRMLADIYVLLGDKLTNMNTPQEKMNYLASTIAVLWKENTFELNEFTAGIKTFAATASNFNLTVDQMMALLATSSTLMQRGSAGGTQLSRVFIQLAQKSELAGRYLNKIIDPKTTGYWEVFMQVVEKMNTEMQAGIPIMDEIVDIFDIRASKSVAGFAQKFDLLVKQLKTATMSPGEKSKAFEEFFQTQIDTIDRQLKIMDELKKQTVEAFAIGVTGATDYVSSLKIINDFFRNTLIPTTMWWGIALRNVGKTAAEIAQKIINPAGLTEQQKIIEDMKKRFSAKQEPIIGTTAGIAEEFKQREKVFNEQLKKFINTNNVADKMTILKAMGYSPEEAEKTAIAFSSSIDEVEYRLQNMYGNIDKRTVEQENKQKILNQLKNQGVLIADQERQDLEWRVMMLDRMKIYGATDIEIQRQKLALQTDNNKKKDEELKLQQMINEEAIAYSETLRTSLSGSFKDMFAGTGGIGDLFSNLNNAMVESFRTTASEGLANMVMATGIGDMFGGAMSKLKANMGGIRGIIEAAHETVYGQIVKGHRDGISGSRLGIGSSIPGASEAGWGGSISAAGGVLAQQGPFWAGMTGQRAPQDRQVTSIGGRPVMLSQTRQNKSYQYGAIAGMGTQSALTGYSAYQSARAGGVSQAQSIGSGVALAGSTVAMGISAGLGAGGFLGGATASTAGTLLGMGPVGWLILGVGLMVVGLMAAFMGSKKSSQTTSETKTTENRISSRIEVTNKNLEIINRNLIALRSDIRTYILPASAYFAEKRNTLEEEFSLMSRRGFQSR